MPKTYTPIATTTLSTSSLSITFSSIPQTYTDLVLVTHTKYATTASHCLLQFNSDTSTNYSSVYMWGTGSAASAGQQSNTYGCFIGRATTTEFGVGVTHIQNYRSSTALKTVLSRGSVASTISIAYANLWRSTSAITSLSVVGNSSDLFLAGSTFTLYGILKA